jgi:hypothetical protein
MAGILDLLNSDLGKQIISGTANQTGQSTDKTSKLLSMAMPLLMGAMKKNASSEQGAQGLMTALSSKHDGSILDNLGGLFDGGVNESVIKDGEGILNHVLGAKQPMVQNALSQQSGIDANSVSQILKVAAPILMGVLGKEQRQSKVNNSNDLTSLLGGLIGNQPDEEQSLITRLLDADGDGSIIDDVAGMVLGGKKKGGLAGMLGGLFR